MPSLVSTGDVRTWLHLDEGDNKPNDKISNLIDAVEAFCDNFTNRKLAASRYSTHPDFSYLDGPGGMTLWLPQYPLSWVGTIYVDSERDFNSDAYMVTSSDLVIYWEQGKLYSENEEFELGHKNIKADYIAGYGASTVSSYPVPYDLKQTIIEIVIEQMKEGITGLHTVEGQQETKIIQMLASNSFWRQTLNSYKNFSIGIK